MLRCKGTCCQECANACSWLLSATSASSETFVSTVAHAQKIWIPPNPCPNNMHLHCAGVLTFVDSQHAYLITPENNWLLILGISNVAAAQSLLSGEQATNVIQSAFFWVACACQLEMQKGRASAIPPSGKHKSTGHIITTSPPTLCAALWLTAGVTVQATGTLSENLSALTLTKEFTLPPPFPPPGPPEPPNAPPNLPSPPIQPPSTLYSPPSPPNVPPQPNVPAHHNKSSKLSRSPPPNLVPSQPNVPSDPSDPSQPQTPSAPPSTPVIPIGGTSYPSPPPPHPKPPKVPAHPKASHSPLPTPPPRHPRHPRPPRPPLPFPSPPPPKAELPPPKGRVLPDKMTASLGSGSSGYGVWSAPPSQPKLDLGEMFSLPASARSPPSLKRKPPPLKAKSPLP